jgi:hypothetical protein
MCCVCFVCMAASIPTILHKQRPQPLFWIGESATKSSQAPHLSAATNFGFLKKTIKSNIETLANSRPTPNKLNIE